MIDLKLTLPTEYKIDYSKVKKNQKYYNNNSKIIREMLLNASKGYCMYCGKKTISDGEDISQIEHSVDKDGNINQTDKDCFLTNCKFNFASACPKCNMSYKKKIRKVTLPDPEYLCSDECADMCPMYLSLRENYVTLNQIILQPQGYPLNGMKCGIEYDLIDHYYKHTDAPTDSDLIYLTENHIQRFHLNSDRITTAVLEICEIIIILYDSGVNEISSILNLLDYKEFSNYLGYIFVEWIKSTFIDSAVDDLIDFCKFQIIISDIL